MALLRRRRMTRVFSGGPAVEDLRFVCAEALRAPSAGFSQGTHLLVLTESDLEDFWSSNAADSWFSKRARGVLQATAVVLVFGDRQAYLERYGLPDKADLGLTDPEAWAVPYWLTDAAMVAQNLLLLAEERRWGALFFGLTKEHGEYLRSRQVPDTVFCIGAIAVGYRSDEDQSSGSPKSRSRHPAAEHIHQGLWSR